MNNLSAKNPCRRCSDKGFCTSICAKAAQWQEKAIEKLAQYEETGFEPWEMQRVLEE